MTGTSASLVFFLCFMAMSSSNAYHLFINKNMSGHWTCTFFWPSFYVTGQWCCNILQISETGYLTLNSIMHHVANVLVLGVLFSMLC